MKLTCTASDGARWEIYEDDGEKWRWQCKEVNRRIVLASHKGYEVETECIENARRPGLDADAVPKKQADGTRACIGENGDEWIFYKERVRDKWRWRRCIKTPWLEGRLVVGKSSQGYHNFDECLDNARRPGMDCDPDVLDQFMD